MRSEKKKLGRRSWSELEVSKTLDYLLETIRNGKQIEKPNAIAYYQRAASHLLFEICTAVQLKSQVYYLKKKYLEAVKWREQTGQGILVADGEDSVKAILLKMCPHFEKLDEIFGSKISTIPPTVLDSGRGFSLNDGTGYSTSEVPVQNCSSEEIGIGRVEENTSSGQSVKILSGVPQKNSLKRKSETGITALAAATKLRLEGQQAELKIRRKERSDEKVHRRLVLQLERQRFEFEKEMAERKVQVEEERTRNDFEVAKLNIEKEIQLAKINMEKELQLAKLAKE